MLVLADGVMREYQSVPQNHRENHELSVPRVTMSRAADNRRDWSSAGRLFRRADRLNMAAPSWRSGVQLQRVCR